MVVRHAGRQREIQRAVAQCRQDGGQQAFRNLELGRGHALPEIVQHVRQHAQHHHGRHAHCHPRLRTAEQLADVLARQGQLGLGKLRPHRQVFAAFGDLDALGAAREQRRFELRFQFLDGLGHRRLAQVQAARRGADAA
jgi:hypothetical protein